MFTDSELEFIQLGSDSILIGNHGKVTFTRYIYFMGWKIYIKLGQFFMLVRIIFLNRFF
jgi:hypothetical protein